MATAAALAAFLTACQNKPAGKLQLEADDPVRVLQRVNEAGAVCWMKSGDNSFRDLRLIPELDTTAGRPRLLLLPIGKTEGLPSLVIEASGSPVAIETYGPLAGTRIGDRVNADVARWSGGSLSCRG